MYLLIFFRIVEDNQGASHYLNINKKKQTKIIFYKEEIIPCLY